MFARVLTADIPEDRRDPKRVAEILQAGALPIVAREDGFQSVTFLFDKQSGKLMSITLFDSESHMRTAHEEIKSARNGVLDQLGASHVAAESFEVVASRKI
jgi:hypothetical protein